MAKRPPRRLYLGPGLLRRAFLPALAGELRLSITGGVLVNPSADLTIDYAVLLGLQWRVYAEGFNSWLSGCLYLSGLAGIGVELDLARHFSQLTEFLYIGDNPGLITFGEALALRYRC